MEHNEPTMLDLLLEAHVGLERQGPGSPAAVARALAFLEPLDRFAQIADLGCGTGGQTFLLAERLSGQITGLDLFPAFADAFNAEAKRRGLEDRVHCVTGDMAQLPFEKEAFDLIWSEGAIDNVGFRQGLRHWRDHLRTGGCIAVTCPSWLTAEHPAEAARFWAEAGSALDPIGQNVAVMQDCGFRFLAAFSLPEECWTERYFAPRARAIEAMEKKYPDSETMKAYAAMNRQEVALYEQYGRHYGYVFYIGEAI